MMSSKLFVRKIEAGDNSGVESLIKAVMPEFGASGPGFAIHDPEVTGMYEVYQKNRHIYFVLTDGREILGGGGIAPLAGCEDEICELRKMYFFDRVRGLGFGQEIMTRCLQSARDMGFKKCYLETLNGMDQAIKLYIKNGFKKLDSPLGSTGHFGCDLYFLLDL